MKGSVLTSLFITLLFFQLTKCITSENLKLELIQVLFRHGARTPNPSEAKILGVKDPSIYKPPSFYQLTNGGKNQVYTLGQMLREKYNALLGAYESKEVYALTSNHDRTKMSLQLVLAGLLPPSPEEYWNDHLHWNPTPFFHSTSKCDILLEPYNCPAYEEVYKKEISNSKDYQNRISKYAEFLKFLKQVTGISYESNILGYAGWTWSGITIHKMMNLSLPAWHNDTTFKLVEQLYNIGFDGQSLTDQLKRLNGGTMVRRMIDNIQIKSNSTEAKKIYLYSGHDTTLAAFIRAQQLTSFTNPPFGSGIIMEKYRDHNNDEYIKMLSWDGVQNNFTSVRIANCNELCPMKQYLELVKNVVPSDEDLNFLSTVKE